MRPSRIAAAAAAVLLLAPLVAAAAVKATTADCVIPTTDGSCVRVLYAGQSIAVGRVEVRRDGAKALVVYRVTSPGWTLIETHLYAGSVPPTTNAPGQFPYKHEWINSSVDVYPLELGSATECLYVAAHGIVAAVTSRETPNLALLASTLPPEISLRVASPGPAGLASYFDATLDGVDLLLLDGAYDAWCADAVTLIDPAVTYQAKVYSSYEALEAGLVPKPENLDLANWVINQDWAARGYAVDDVQCALWKLMGFECTAEYAVAIVEEAALHEGYVPATCNARIGLILAPYVDGTAAQTLLVQVPIAQLGSFCYATYDPAVTETAWGCGDTRLRGGWGTYLLCGDCDVPTTQPPGGSKKK